MLGEGEKEKLQLVGPRHKKKVAAVFLVLFYELHHAYAVAVAVSRPAAKLLLIEKRQEKKNSSLLTL